MILHAIDYHRNGISGLGFHVMIVEDEGREILVVRFPEEADKETGSIVCAVFDLKKLDERDIAFFSNSFRGDRFSKFADECIRKLDAEKIKSEWKKREDHKCFKK